MYKDSEEAGKTYHDGNYGNYESVKLRQEIASRIKGFDNALYILIGRKDDIFVVIGDFGKFLSGHIYFGKPYQSVEAPNGLSVGQFGMIDIIITSKEDGTETVDFGWMKPMSRTQINHEKFDYDGDLDGAIEYAIGKRMLCSYVDISDRF